MTTWHWILMVNAGLYLIAQVHYWRLTVYIEKMGCEWLLYKCSFKIRLLDAFLGLMLYMIPVVNLIALLMRFSKPMRVHFGRGLVKGLIRPVENMEGEPA